MVARLLAVMLVLAAPAVAVAQTSPSAPGNVQPGQPAAGSEQASDLSFTRPAGWGRSVDDESHLVILTPPGGHASATFIAGQDFAGTGDAWHRGLWDQLGSDLKLHGTATEGQRGDIAITWAAFDKSDGTQAWLCLYTFVKNGRGEGVLYFADGEGPFQANRATVDRLVDGLSLAPAGSQAAAASTSASLYAVTPASAADAAATPGAAAPDGAAAGAPTDLVVSLPPGWTQKVDAKSKVIFMRPPDAKSTATNTDVEIVIMPAQTFAGTADEWHAAALKFAQRGARLLEPVRKVAAGGMLVSSAHLVDAKGTEQRQVVYTARWGTRAQMFVFLATHDDAFTKDGPVADRAITQVVVPGAGNAAAMAQTNPPAQPAAADLPPAQPAEDRTVPASSSNLPPAPGNVPPGASGAALPAEIAVDTPPGWSRQQDPQTRTIYMKPPDSPAINMAGLVVFPAMNFAGTAKQFHNQTLATAMGQGRLLEPANHGTAGGFLATAVHYVTPQGGKLRLVLYTARWGNRGQAVLFATARDDLFQNNAMAANAAILAVTVPGAAPAAPAAAGGPMAPGPMPGSMSAAPPPMAAVASTGADGGDTMPVLEYADPPNFFRGAIGGKNCAEYQGSDVNFTLCVYAFREFQGDIRSTFQQSLLRDWIDVMYQEEGVASRPRFATYTTPGTDAAIGANFLDARQQEHFRLLLVAGHWAALVDMIAPTAFAYQKGFASAVQLLNSLHVGRKAAPPSVAQGPGPQGAALAGLFQGMRGKTVSNLMLGPGYLNTQTALHFYLFSADGHVYRCYDFPPGGSAAAARQFDFDGAARQDPGNSGRFTVRGNQLYMKFGGPNADEITTTVTDPNTLQLDGVSYERKQ